jgi:rubrerythrin
MSDPSRKIETREIRTNEVTGTEVESSIIPSSFWLGGLKIDVEYDNTLARNKNFIGEARYSEQRVVLDPSVSPIQTLEQSFLHELVHWIFYLMNEDELRNNEKIVDLFSHFLYQALVTAKHESIKAEEVPF